MRNTNKNNQMPHNMPIWAYMAQSILFITFSALLLSVAATAAPTSASEVVERAAITIPSING